MRKEFEKHCEDYNLVYDFAQLGDNYADKNTHQAYCLFKSLSKNTINNSDYTKCSNELIQYFEDRKYPKNIDIIDIIKEHLA